MHVLPISIVLAASLAAPAAAPILTPAGASLVAAEYAFTDQAAKDGTRAAFLGALHKDGMVFIPRPVNGVTYYKTQLEFDALLQWFPIRVETSAAGDLGYSTGPWTFRASKDAPDAAYGWFVSLWERDGDTPWKVRLDIGISTPDPSELPPQTPMAREKAALPPAPAAQPTTGSPELLALDTAFSDQASKPNGITDAYKSRIDASVRFYRKGRFPLEGAASLQRYLDPYPVAFHPTESIVSGSSDLALTRGTMNRKDPAGETVANYVHIWKKVAGAWKLAVEVEVPAK